MESMDKLLTVEELAEFWRCSPGTVRNKLSAGEDMPPSIKVAGRRLFPLASLVHWMKSLEQGKKNERV